MKTPLKTNIALSPIGYWPYGVRPIAKGRLKIKDKMRGKRERVTGVYTRVNEGCERAFNKADYFYFKPILRILPLLLVMGLSLAGCSQLATNRHVMKATLNNLLDASYAFLSHEAAAVGHYFAESAAYWNRA